MKLVFWQNIISPHQADLMAELAKEHEVILIVEREVDEYRQGQAWSTSLSDLITLIVSPTLRDIYQLIRLNSNSIHIFSGFFAYKIITTAFVMSAMFNNKIYIISEAVESVSFKGKLKLQIRRIFASLFRSKVLGVFATGNYSYDYFLKLGFDRKRINEFGYFVDVKPSGKRLKKQQKKKVIFVGRLVKCKGISDLIKSFSILIQRNPDYFLEIIGGGVLESELKSQAKQLGLTNDEITFTSNMNRENVLFKIEMADVLVLPNVSEEGWGVVVNEALLLGTPVICSQFTGANVIITPCVQGEKVNLPDEDGFINAILSMKNYNRELILREAQNRILPCIIAPYLIRIFNGINTDFSPWSKP